MSFALLNSLCDEQIALCEHVAERRADDVVQYRERHEIITRTVPSPTRCGKPARSRERAATRCWKRYSNRSNRAGP